jgi:SAM-dependent methyltransferase
VGIFGVLPFLRRQRSTAVLAGLCLGLAGIGSFERDTSWSPYYKVTRQPISLNGVPLGFDLSVNEDSHQQAIDLSGRFDTVPDFLMRRQIYDEPYRFGRNDRVLVVGAGTGNDVAAALRAGASSVVAVEIDRRILRLGAMHPERPYADPRVTSVVADARSFIRASEERWDKIVLGYLDSHSLFSAMSSVRLDNFVYTVESFRELRDRLTADGILAVTFTVHEGWIADRIHGMLREAFGSDPLVFQGYRTASSGTVFLAGEPVRHARVAYAGFTPRAAASGPSWNYHALESGYLPGSAFSDPTILPRDNWPYLYLRDRELPVNYLTSIIALLTLAVTATLWTMRGGASVNLQFFFLGAGFLLVETKAMTELGLFMGSTWTVNVLVIVAVLILILLANALATRPWCPPSRVLYGALIVVLLASWSIPLAPLLAWSSPARNPVAVAVLTLPLFFAGVIFSRELRIAPSSSGALGANLLGALIGGAAEYSGMVLGFRSLYLVGLGFYALAWLSSVVGRSRAPGTTGLAAMPEAL